MSEYYSAAWHQAHPGGVEHTDAKFADRDYNVRLLKGAAKLAGIVALGIGAVWSLTAERPQEAPAQDICGERPVAEAFDTRYDQRYADPMQIERHDPQLESYAGQSGIADLPCDTLTTGLR